ncbi:DUF4942 domain-containing protein [Candidatus Methylospira mobilis]|uniref:DUF4942 domain-containing protein n=1 Tax=Candidatus Methylospira mobilis TaxID=1808979 RepID=A0A5Q0BS70_9GAMM|nr:DUF4942 domain-containing protein [Candidatus Methylospira mobilis]QFY45024.1 DUF4942 domain-containing protein [Candidatus Methylospira mobilis]
MTTTTTHNSNATHSADFPRTPKAHQKADGNGEDTANEQAAFSDVVKSVSIENLINQRAAVKAMLQQAHEIILKASQVAAEAHLGCVADLFETYSGMSQSVAFTKEGAVDRAMNVLDRKGWQYLMEQSGMRTFMDNAARKEWDTSVYEGKIPELTKDNITATFQKLHESRGDLFDRGVINCFHRLSWNYKTNQPFKFGKRLIINRFLDGSGQRWAYLSHSTSNELDDLLRVFHVLDGKPEPDHRQGIYYMVANMINDHTAWIGDYFSLKWFKNGNAHLNFTRPDLVDQMNRILAKHYPDALAAQN